MKIYKRNFLIILIIFPIITFFLYLYKNDRLIILYRKYNNDKINFFSFSEDKIYGIFFNNFIIETIPLSINFEDFDKNNPEDFLYKALYQYFHYININFIGKISYELHHVVLEKKSVIINGSLYASKLMSAQEEFLFLKGIFLTLENIIPGIEVIYFYDDQELLKLKYINPFITKKMISYKLDQTLINADILNRKINKVTIIPYFEGNGNCIDKIFEKNFFQKYNNDIYIPKNKKNTDLYFKEINQLHINNSNQLIIFLSLVNSIEDKIEIISYPILSEDSLIEIKQEYSLPKFDSLLNSICLKFKNILINTSFFCYPFIPFFNIVYPSLYIILYSNNKEKITENIEKIKKIIL
jgi:hypothetical protein